MNQALDSHNSLQIHLQGISLAEPALAFLSAALVVAPVSGTPFAATLFASARLEGCRNDPLRLAGATRERRRRRR